MTNLESPFDIIRELSVRGNEIGLVDKIFGHLGKEFLK